jgi:nucleotide-binding universal stress UspA family protein
VVETLRPDSKTILCTIDFSESSGQAIEWALSLAQHMRAHLSIRYAYRLVQSRGGDVAHLKRNIEDQARHKFQQIEQDHLLGKGVAYDFEIEVGFISDRISAYAKKNNLNMIIMDKHVNTHSGETFEELMNSLSVPMLLIP